MTRRLAAFVLVGLSACAATVGTSGNIYVPKDAAATCNNSCNQIGLRLSSVVIMANEVGCVCGATTPPTGTDAAAAGMAAVITHRASETQPPPSLPVTTPAH